MCQRLEQSSGYLSSIVEGYSEPLQRGKDADEDFEGEGRSVTSHEKAMAL